jgi:anion-transporting  ArsA/GET3 family ATPase
MADPSADRQRARRLEQLLSAKEIVVTCGAGGVGKTTVAAALAATAASRLDARVLVLTVDPARRLADALGIGALGNAVRRIPNEAFEKAGLRPRGALYAAMLDMGESWDALISGMHRTPRPLRRSLPTRCIAT